MKREIIKIDEEKCNGCGLCIPNCHEGALQIIDGKARLISELMCDGLGACTGHCPEGAMEIEFREAEAYDELKVMEEMVKKGKNVVTAHMKHLKDHGEFVFLRQAVEWLTENSASVDFPVREIIENVHQYNPTREKPVTAMKNIEKKSAVEAVNSPASPGEGCGSASRRHHHADIPVSGAGSGCPGSASMSFATSSSNGINKSETMNENGSGAGDGGAASRLMQWPVQMHLINPRASHFAGSDLLLAADCVAYALGNFHEKYLRGKTLAIACPKLDANKEVYHKKLVSLINDAKINTLTVMKMEVPCCSGIEQMAVAAAGAAESKVPVKSITLSVRGEIIDDRWL